MPKNGGSDCQASYAYNICRGTEVLIAPWQVDPSINQLKKSSKKSTYFLLLHRVGKDVSKSVSNITTSRFYLNWYSWLSYLWKWSKMPPKFVVFCRFGAQKAKITYKSIKQNVFVFKNCIFRGVDHFFSPKDTRDMTYSHAKRLRNHRILTKC